MPGIFITVMDEVDIGQWSSDQVGEGKSMCLRWFRSLRRTGKRYSRSNRKMERPSWRARDVIRRTKMQWDLKETRLNSSGHFSQDFRHFLFFARSRKTWRQRTSNQKTSRTGSSSCLESITMRWGQFPVRWGLMRRPTGFIFLPRAFPFRRNNFGNALHLLFAVHTCSPSSQSRSWEVVHSLSLQALLGTAPLRRTSHRAALGAPRGLSRVCFGCVFFTLESGGVGSGLARVALLDTDLQPPPLSLVTVALLPSIFLLFSSVCISVVGRVFNTCSNWRWGMNLTRRSKTKINVQWHWVEKERWELYFECRRSGITRWDS